MVDRATLTPEVADWFIPYTNDKRHRQTSAFCVKNPLFHSTDLIYEGINDISVPYLLHCHTKTHINENSFYYFLCWP